MIALLRWLFFNTLVRPLIMVVLGVNIRNRELLPSSGPAIIVANHNSHLDTLVLMTLCPGRALPSLRPVAAADYWLKNPYLSWFALNIIGIVPIRRSGRGEERDPLAGASEALKQGRILILFPEGSRGEPGEISNFKSGVARLVERHPEAEVIPVRMEGLDRALPKGEMLLVPLFCDVFVGDKVPWSGERSEFLQALQRSVEELREGG